jgi:hypothetical protein
LTGELKADFFLPALPVSSHTPEKSDFSKAVILMKIEGGSFFFKN